MQKASIQKGSAHVIVIAVLALALAGTLGFVFYQKFIAKTQSTTTDSVAQSDTKSTTNASQASSKPATTIGNSDRSGWSRYTNNTIGYQFDFPSQAYGSTGCHPTNKWYDSYGSLVTAPVTSYLVDEGVADLTVLDYPARGMAVIAQKRAPLFTEATYSERSYNSACEMVDVTAEKLLDRKDTSKSFSTSWRPLQVFKLSSQDEIATKATLIYGLPGNDVITGARYSLGKLTNGRQAVTYDYDVKSGEELVGYGRVDTFYYPEQKVLVSFAFGQSAAFSNDRDLSVIYDQEIFDSLKLIK